MSREDKILEFINECKVYDKDPALSDDFHRAIKSKICRILDFYDILERIRQKGNRDYTSSYALELTLVESVKKTILKYNPKVTPEMVLEKEVEVDGTNKKGIKTGKRATMRFGRWLGQAFPFLNDTQKEKLVDWYSDNYSPINATFHRTTTCFEAIVTKPMGKRVGFNTTMWQKSLANSCMRYDAEGLGLSRHPYSAYESGDWELCYLLDNNDKLLGRCLVNLPTGTHSAIYGVSNPAIQVLKEEMRKLGYTQASEGAEEWDGSKLLYNEDTYSDDEDDYEMPVFLMPYIDIFEGFAYHDRKYIYLSASSDKPFNSYYVEPFEASGFNER